MRRKETKPAVKLVAVAGTCLAVLACPFGLAAWAVGGGTAQLDLPVSAGQAWQGARLGEDVREGPASAPSAAPSGGRPGVDRWASSGASGGRAWVEGVRGSENLVGYTAEQLDGLRSELEGYLHDRGYGGLAGRLECLRAPEVGSRWSVVWFRVSNTREYLTAQMNLADGTWRVFATGGGVEGVSDGDAVVTTSDAGQVEVYDLGSLRALLGEVAGSALFGQYDAWSRESGTRDGIPFLPIDSVARDGAGGISLSIVYGALPNSAVSPDYQVRGTFDATSATWVFERQAKA